MTYSESQFSQLSDELWHVFGGRRRFPTTRGVACAVRSSLLPLRLPDPAGTECLLIRLRSVSVVVAVCYRPPDDNTVLGRMTDVLSRAAESESESVSVQHFSIIFILVKMETKMETEITC